MVRDRRIGTDLEVDHYLLLRDGNVIATFDHGGGSSTAALDPGGSHGKLARPPAPAGV